MEDPKGDSLTRIHAQLQREWVEASLGSSLPLVPLEFRVECLGFRV